MKKDEYVKEVKDTFNDWYECYKKDIVKKQFLKQSFKILFKKYLDSHYSNRCSRPTIITPALLSIVLEYEGYDFISM